MELTPELLGVLSGIFSSVMASGISHGSIKAKVSRLEKDIENKVDRDFFDATVKPMHSDLHEMKNDLKELLRVVQRTDLSKK